MWTSHIKSSTLPYGCNRPVARMDFRDADNVHDKAGAVLESKIAGNREQARRRVPIIERLKPPNHGPPLPA